MISDKVTALEANLKLEFYESNNSIENILLLYKHHR